MRKTGPKKSKLERKLQEIEREKRRLDDEMKSLSRAIKKGQTPALISSPSRVEPGAMSTHQSSGGRVRGGDIGSAGASRSPGGEKTKVRGDARFANYFSTGGLKTPLPNRQGSAVQRNKTVFIIIVLVLVFFILLRMFR